MSDATAATPQPAPDPDAPIPHDGPTFVHNGIIRFPMGDQIVRVRRPFLGELRQIRSAFDEVQDVLSAESARVLAAGKDLQAQVTEIQAQFRAKEIDEATKDDRLAEITVQDITAARKLDETREQAVLDWWAQVVFPMLALDPVPDQLQWPTWMLDQGNRTRPGLVAKVLAHWRTVPTGPG